jgi:hypothetical protein
MQQHHFSQPKLANPDLAEVGSCWDIVEKLETGIEELTTAVIALKPEFSGATQCEVVGSAKHIPLLREGSSMSLLVQSASASIPHKNYLQTISCFKLASLSAHHNTEQLHRSNAVSSSEPSSTRPSKSNITVLPLMQLLSAKKMKNRTARNSKTSTSFEIIQVRVITWTHSP